MLLEGTHGTSIAVSLSLQVLEGSCRAKVTLGGTNLVLVGTRRAGHTLTRLIVRTGSALDRGLGNALRSQRSARSRSDACGGGALRAGIANNLALQILVKSFRTRDALRATNDRLICARGAVLAKSLACGGSEGSGTAELALCLAAEILESAGATISAERLAGLGAEGAGCAHITGHRTSQLAEASSWASLAIYRTGLVLVKAL
jgi:hypothetical protein